MLGCGPEEPTVVGTDAPVLLAAGDIASCASDVDRRTAALVRRTEGTVATLGDNAYPKGSAKDFADCYEPTWGDFKKRTKPVPGNHEYLTAGAKGYFEYFEDMAGQPGKGYYSYDLGEWHIVALNSLCSNVGGCSDDDPQAEWLRADLAENDDKACTLAYFHYPFFTSGKYRPGISNGGPLWDILYEADADVVLSAHDHNYQRFAPQNPGGSVDPESGIRQFVVGTGGGEDLHEIQDPLRNVQAYDDQTFGILKLTLQPEGYEWRFVPVDDKGYTDSGWDGCH
jgi:hypothetical protein